MYPTLVAASYSKTIALVSTGQLSPMIMSKVTIMVRIMTVSLSSSTSCLEMPQLSSCVWLICFALSQFQAAGFHPGLLLDVAEIHPHPDLSQSPVNLTVNCVSPKRSDRQHVPMHGNPRLTRAHARRMYVTVPIRRMPVVVIDADQSATIIWSPTMV